MRVLQTLGGVVIVLLTLSHSAFALIKWFGSGDGTGTNSQCKTTKYTVTITQDAQNISGTMHISGAGDFYGSWKTQLGTDGSYKEDVVFTNGGIEATISGVIASDTATFKAVGLCTWSGPLRR